MNHARHRHGRLTRPAVLLIALGLGLGMAPRVGAHGGEHTLQVDRAPLGELALTVWTGPARLRPGDILLESLVTSPEGGDAVEGLRLSYTVASDGGHHGFTPQVLPAAAVDTLSERNLKEELHLAVVRLDAPGRYEVTAEVLDGSQKGMWHSFAIDVVPDNPGFIITIKILGVLTLLLAAAFIFHTLGRVRLLWRTRADWAAGPG